MMVNPQQKDRQNKNGKHKKSNSQAKDNDKHILNLEEVKIFIN